MGSEYTFYDYIDADRTDRNIVNDWLNNEGKEAKQGFNAIIRRLEESPPYTCQDSCWGFPATKPLTGNWDGFTELRKQIKRIQYRLIIKEDHRNVHIVTWGRHNDDWQTDITSEKANERVEQMKSNPIKYRRNHDFK